MQAREEVILLFVVVFRVIVLSSCTKSGAVFENMADSSLAQVCLLHATQLEGCALLLPPVAVLP
jgi:hypothetical protein